MPNTIDHHRAPGGGEAGQHQSDKNLPPRYRLSSHRTLVSISTHFIL